MSTDPTAIATELFAQLETAWNAADGAAFGKPFADVTDFVDVRGAHHHGDGVAIGGGHQHIFDTIYKGSTVRYQVTSARQVVPGCFVATVSATLDAPSGPLPGTNQSRITAVVVREGDRWAITAFHNTLVLQAPRA
ncbi:SgcJ/EcaC family oxidoreductase [Longimicrobium sp.]|uniref:SgcJ/EcaC family oxidoreductase n=1 Tax=Longimicrobium sp. TaxID=2029185 RepID=UPI002ED9259C